MNRRLWGSVAGILTLLGGASFAFGAKQGAEVPSSLLALGQDAARALARLPWTVVTVLAAAALLLASFAWWVERRRRIGHSEPWRQVILLGKQGRSISVIARDTGLPQDAVRIVLAPVSLDPSFPRGNSFRSSPPPSPERSAEDRSRRRP